MYGNLNVSRETLSIKPSFYYIRDNYFKIDNCNLNNKIVLFIF